MFIALFTDLGVLAAVTGHQGVADLHDDPVLIIVKGKKMSFGKPCFRARIIFASVKSIDVNSIFFITAREKNKIYVYR